MAIKNIFKLVGKKFKKFDKNADSININTLVLSDSGESDQTLTRAALLAHISHVAATSGNPHSVTKSEILTGNLIVNADVDNAAAIVYAKLSIADTDLTIAKTNGLQAALNAKVDDSEKGANSGVATLDATGKLSSGQIPPMSITSTYVVANEAAQLALTVQEGDVAVRSDESKSYIALNADNVNMADWQVLLTPTDAVQSVNGETGVVVLNTDHISEDGAPVNLWFTDARAKAATVSDIAYAGSWDGVTTIAPSKNAVYDKIEAMSSGLVSDVAYNEGTWDGVTTIAPSKNAIRDKIEAMLTDIASNTTHRGLSNNPHSVTKAQVLSGDLIVNADIDAGAAIADSKLAQLTTASKVAGSAVQLNSDGSIVNSTGLKVSNEEPLVNNQGVAVTIGQVGIIDSTGKFILVQNDEDADFEEVRVVKDASIDNAASGKFYMRGAIVARAGTGGADVYLADTDGATTETIPVAGDIVYLGRMNVAGDAYRLNPRYIASL